jgi:GDP-mannose 4,6-dehydratase
VSKHLITGICGFVASHLAKYLLSQKEEVAGTYRWQEDSSRIKDIRDKLSLYFMDLNDEISILRTLSKSKPNYIHHLAAESFVNYSYDVPIQTVETNTVGTVRLLEAVRYIREFQDSSFDPIILVCSSSEYYGKVNKDEIPIKETNSPRPGNQYAVGKVGADAAADFYHRYYGLKIIRTRFFTHTGWGRTMQSAEVNFARQIARIEKGLQEPVVRHGNLDSVRTWANVKDAVKAYYLLCSRGTVGEVYNIGGKIVKTIGDMLDYMISLSTVKNIKKQLDPTLVRNLDVNLQIVDISKFERDVNWSPEISFEETIKDVLEYQRSMV